MKNEKTRNEKNESQANKCQANQSEPSQNEPRQNETVAQFVNFQLTGVGFDGVWADIGPIVDGFVRGRLRKFGVWGPGGADELAVGEVVSLVVERLMGLAAPGAGGRFDPARAQPGLSGLKGWLFRVVNSQAVNWLRDFRGGRGVKMIPESCLAWNDSPGGVEGDSFLDRLPAKFEQENLWAVIKECIATLPDPLMRQVVQLKLDQDLSVAETAKLLNVTTSKVQRRRKKAYKLLEVMLRDRGIDGSVSVA